MKLRNSEAENVLSWLLKLLIASLSSIVFTFIIERMSLCSWRKLAMFCWKMSLHSVLWSKWTLSKQSLQINYWWRLQNTVTNWSLWVSQNTRGTLALCSTNCLTYRLGSIGIGLSQPLGKMWSEWQKPQSKWPFTAIVLFYPFIMLFSTHDLQAVWLQHIKLIGSRFVRLKRLLHWVQIRFVAVTDDCI